MPIEKQETMSQVKEDLKSFLIMEEIPLTVDEDMDEMYKVIDKYVRNLSDNEADLELTLVTL